MQQHIRLLDCTLRDGGHLNNGEFGETVIKNTIERLVEARTDIIELGFLWDKPCDVNVARYHTIEDVKRVLPNNCGVSKFALMADYIDLDHLEPYDGTIEYIRLSFKRWRLDWGLTNAKLLMNKGYKVFINPVNCNVYSDKEYIEVLEKVNEIHPYGFTMVDTFGVMRINDLSHRYFMVENTLHEDIAIGLHLHENLGLAYSLAQHFCQIVKPRRKAVIDGSLLGIGRVPGNLCIEQMMDHVNNQYGNRYITAPIFDAIDDYIVPIKNRIPWGYAIPYALSAKFNLHRTYAEYLINKQRLRTKDIQNILGQVSKKEAETFNEEYIQELYLKYMNVKYAEVGDLKKLCDDLSDYKDIIVIAPGQSIVTEKEKILKRTSNDSCVISVNFDPEIVASDYIFLTNIKRFDSIKERKNNNRLIITSNLIRDIVSNDYIVSYEKAVCFQEGRCEDSTLMLLNLLKKVGRKKVMVAGFDGIKNGKLEFFDDSFGRCIDAKSSKEQIKNILSLNFTDMDIEFITDSEYAD